MKELSVVILNWNGRKLLEEFLPSVIAHTPKDIAEVVIADNGSTDDSVTYLQQTFPEVRLILLDRNYGFAEGYNKALESVTAEYTVLLNSDVEVSAGWTDEPLRMLRNEASIACVQPKILAQRDKEYFEYAGAAGGFIDRYGYPFCRGRILHIVEKDNGQYDAPTDVLWTTGACLFIRTAVYKNEGGLDKQFFAHQEEVDMCWRLRCRGYRLVCTPKSVVYHVGGATLKVESPRKTYLNFRNNLLMLYKNLPEAELRRVMLARFCFDYLAAIKFLLGGHWGNVKAVYTARRDYYKMRPTYKSVREENLRKTILQTIPERIQSSLILSFYIRGWKSFKSYQSTKGRI
jgi:Predicted glycosyltransferases